MRKIITVGEPTHWSTNEVIFPITIRSITYQIAILLCCMKGKKLSLNMNKCTFPVILVWISDSLNTYDWWKEEKLNPDLLLKVPEAKHEEMHIINAMLIHVFATQQDLRGHLHDDLILDYEEYLAENPHGYVTSEENFNGLLKILKGDLHSLYKIIINNIPSGFQNQLQKLTGLFSSIIPPTDDDANCFCPRLDFLFIRKFKIKKQQTLPTSLNRAAKGNKIYSVKSPCEGG